MPRSSWLTWVAPALVAAVLGGWRLTGPALWADELATWGAVRLSWGQLRELTGTVDIVLAPYYAAMKAYASIAGTSTVALRLPALLAIVATTLLTTALGRRLGGPAAGLVAGLIFAVLPATSRYGQEARSYAFAMLAATLALLCLIRLLDRPTVPRAAGYAGALVVTGLSHPLSALLVPAAHAVAVAWRRSPRIAAFWTPAAALGALPALVLTALGARQRGQLSWIKVLTADLLQVVPERIFLSGAVAGIVLGLAVLGVRGSAESVSLAAAGFGPILLLLAAGLVEPIWNARYVLVALPVLAVLAALAAVRSGARPAAVVLLLLTLIGWPAQLAARGPAGHSEDSAKVAAVIAPLYRPGDVAVFPDTHPSIPWAPRDIYERYLPAPRPPDVLRVAPQRTDGHFLATECPAAACLGSPPRIWVIRVDNSADPYANMDAPKRKRLADSYHPVRRWQYSLLGITLLERNPSR
ncbi:glycosyltransferase family 39 protein [Paractinoplanes toevensis]|uniref:glycosyltransferase family 39 protein n=1 Tax=Paractinoplanes toevensis TaxID=571911 RepID=UPI001BB34311|nr:glycosyltransferase family 39 protein [Actinoplanes toevensis]